MPQINGVEYIGFILENRFKAFLDMKEKEQDNKPGREPWIPARQATARTRKSKAQTTRQPFWWSILLL